MSTKSKERKKNVNIGGLFPEDSTVSFRTRIPSADPYVDPDSWITGHNISNRVIEVDMDHMINDNRKKKK